MCLALWVLKELWVFHKRPGDMGERNMENVKEGNGKECSDTGVGQPNIGAKIVQCSPLNLPLFSVTYVLCLPLK